MSSLVLELQQNALNPQTKVTDLLRKALVVATKLSIVEFREWTQHELNGYGEAPIPPYRHIRGEVKAHNPYHGWIPVVFQNEKVSEVLCHRSTGQPIAELEHLLEGEGMLHCTLPDKVVMRLSKTTLGCPPTLVIGQSAIRGVIDAARNIVLEWSLKLEKDGIVGEGMTFSAEEKQKATAITYHIQHLTGVAGSVQATTLQIGDYATIHAELKELGISQRDRNELENILDELQNAAGDKRQSLLKKGLEWTMAHAKELGTLAEVLRSWFPLS